MSASPRITVTFVDDDTPKTLTVRPVGLMAVERRWGGKAFEEHPIEAMLFGAWTSMGNPGGDFDVWAGSIADIVDDAPADPSSATLSEPSPPSP